MKHFLDYTAEVLQKLVRFSVFSLNRNLERFDGSHFGHYTAEVLQKRSGSTVDWVLAVHR